MRSPNRQRLPLQSVRSAASNRPEPSHRLPPRRPQWNGKVERFNRTLLDEWAYVRVYRSETARTADP